MTAEPLLNTTPVIFWHAVCALAALVAGTVQFALPKGSMLHRGIGRVWVLLMLTVAGTSLFIHTQPVLGIWSPIHLLSLLVLVTVPLAVWHARRNRIAEHRRAMIQLYLLALVGAGIFTLWPGRIMHQVVFGG
jgi:uncharacterized membrane protein